MKFAAVNMTVYSLTDPYKNIYKSNDEIVRFVSNHIPRTNIQGIVMKQIDFYHFSRHTNMIFADENLFSFDRKIENVIQQSS